MIKTNPYKSPEGCACAALEMSDVEMLYNIEKDDRVVVQLLLRRGLASVRPLQVEVKAAAICYCTACSAPAA